MSVTRRASDIPPFIVMDVLEKATSMEAQGHSIIHLEAGEPDFDTPKVIKEAAMQALAANHTHYTPSLGIPELRQAIARDYKTRYGVSVDPQRIMVTAGTSPAMLLMFAALLDQDDEVIITDPGYSCYAQNITFMGGKAVRVPVKEEQGFQLDIDELKGHVSPRTKALLINSPGNPTGQLLSPESLAQLAEAAPGKYGPPYIISDEIYHGLEYGGQKSHSILEYTDTAFVLGGFSKRYAMTGWRLGYLIAPEQFVRPFHKMHQNFMICASSVAQWAGVAALEQAEPEVEVMVREFDRRRLALVEGLQKLGFSIPVPPLGAFYLMTRCDHLDADDYRLAFHILEETGVALAPGRDFGPGGHGFLRFAYTNSYENIQEALRRLDKYLVKYYGREPVFA